MRWNRNCYCKPTRIPAHFTVVKGQAHSWLCRFLILSGLLLSVGAEDLSVQREWTLLDGKKIQAKLIGMRDGKVVMANPDGKQGEIPLDLFNSTDLRAIQEFARPKTGRFVRLQRKGVDGILHVAEVQVFSDGKNVAGQGKATMIGNADAKKAVDGNTDASQNNTTSEAKKAKDPWWELDLGQDVPVHRITLWNKVSTGKDRMANLTVSLLGGDRKPVWEQLLIDPPDPHHSFVIALDPTGSDTSPEATATKGDDSPTAQATPEPTEFNVEDIKTPREWALQNGQKFTARFAGRKGGIMLLRLASGKPHKMPISALTRPHRDLVYEATKLPDNNAFARDYHPNVGHDPIFNKLEMKLWLPDREKPVEGVLLILDKAGVDARGKLNDPAYKTFARRHHIALLGCRFSGNEEGVLREEKGPPDMLLKGLAELAEQLEHPEFKKVPLLLFGSEHGGGIAWRMAIEHSERVRGMIANIPYPLEARVNKSLVTIPTLFIVKSEIAPDHLTQARQAYGSLRRVGGRAALMQVAADPKPVKAYVFDWLEVVMGGIGSSGSQAAADMKSKRVVPWNPRLVKFPGACWFPNRELAEAWVPLQIDP